MGSNESKIWSPREPTCASTCVRACVKKQMVRREEWELKGTYMVFIYIVFTKFLSSHVVVGYVEIDFQINRMTRRTFSHPTFQAFWVGEGTVRASSLSTCVAGEYSYRDLINTCPNYTRSSVLANPIIPIRPHNAQTTPPDLHISKINYDSTFSHSLPCSPPSVFFFKVHHAPSLERREYQLCIYGK